jgi:hypothetical protein
MGCRALVCDEKKEVEQKFSCFAEIEMFRQCFMQKELT